MPTSNFKFNGTDLDALFEPIGASSKRADVSYTVGGTDISNYYYSVSNGGTAFGTTNFQAGSVDIGTLFAALGSVSLENFLYAWGKNEDGQLGLNNTTTRSSPVQVGTSSWTSVSAGFSHTAAIRSDNLLFTWGAGTYGRLGDGTIANKSSPVQIGSSSWTSVSAGGAHTAALKT